MKKIFAFLLVFTAAVSIGSAQNEMDALRYSMLDPGGTARFVSMGGAFGALGGDFSSLGINPAGLGLYRSSEITVTPSIGYHTANTSFYNTREEDLKYSFNLSNLGVVFSIPTGASSQDQNGLRYLNIGLGINRHNNFNNQWIANGFNPHSSLMTSFAEQARREGSISNLDDYSTGLAWDTFLLDIDDGIFFADMEDGNVSQRMQFNSSGSIREFVASLGMNYSDRIYFGASIGLPTVSYEQSTLLLEEDTQNRNEFFNSLTFSNKFKTTGTGFNVKAGAIARLGNVVRLGAAFHTPTFFSLKDEYRTEMRSDLNLPADEYPDYDEDARFAQSPRGVFEYELNTPMKAIGSVGFIFGTRGLLSLDYEYIDYTKARLRSDDYMFITENSMIKNNLSNQHAIRTGGEIRFEPLILRAGYAHYSSPYQEGVNDGKRNVLSAGVGIRDRNYSLDFAYSYSFFSEDYALYMIEDVRIPLPIARHDFSTSTFRVTLAWRF